MNGRRRFFSNEVSGSVPSDSDPKFDFLGHLRERLGVDDRAATERLQAWLSAYQPGPAALARAGAGCGE
jgi:hypothetical protein